MAGKIRQPHVFSGTDSKKFRTCTKCGFTQRYTLSLSGSVFWMPKAAHGCTKQQNTFKTWPNGTAAAMAAMAAEPTKKKKKRATSFLKKRVSTETEIRRKIVDHEVERDQEIKKMTVAGARAAKHADEAKYYKKRLAELTAKKKAEKKQNIRSIDVDHLE